MAPHSSTLAWKIPWMEEPGRLQSMGLLRVGHDWATSLSLFTFTHWRRKWQPLQCSCLENPGSGEPGGLPSMGTHRVGHDWSDSSSISFWICTSCVWEFNFLYNLANTWYSQCSKFRHCNSYLEVCYGFLFFSFPFPYTHGVEHFFMCLFEIQYSLTLCLLKRWVIF